MPIEQPLELGFIIFTYWPLLAAAFIILLVILWRKTRSLSYLLCFCVFTAYLLVALDKVFMPLDLHGTYAAALKQIPLSENINLIPFYFGYGTLESSLETLLLNVLLTIPFGFGINFLVHIPARRILWLALAVGLATEGTQLILWLLGGYAYRVIDINDVLMNGLGVLVGYGLFRLFAWLYVWLMQRLHIPHWGLFGYIDDVSNRETSPQRP